MSTDPAPASLTEAQIEQIVQRYRLEMARYDGAARFVEQRLRRELREAAIPALLSSRAKHPADVLDKLRRRADDGRYRHEALLANMNHVMTDVAGCRLIVYDPRQESAAADIVRRTFSLWQAARSYEVLDKDSGYRATHLLVILDAPEVDLALLSTVCEVQVTSIACHVFNELSHDIDYKRKDVSPSGDVQRQLRDVLNATRRLDDVVARLASSRAREIESSKRMLETSEALRFALEQAIDRPLRGEIEKLHRLLSVAVAPLTAHSLAELDVHAALVRGHQVARNLLRAENDNVDDVVALVLGLVTKFGKKFRDLASQWRGPSTALKRAILEVTR
ncbi:MAG TPA: RelA/SpoT domain-containing protein [Kofleriaceae bacterium]|jgi:ppGpp synthetase/RelA/SpoT-type nucleotidyltranferase|nr:RelA/SpoT domain-containing protein [Kofleriaceae bacterium]